MTHLSTLTNDELADGICLRAGRIAAAQAELMRWIAEFDRREGWAGPGMLSCAHWLSWRVGLSPGAAREQVRVARRLEELPAVAAAFERGRMSYSQARALTRVAAPDDGIDWADLARHTSAAQLEKVVRGMRRVQAADEAAADPELAAWKVRTRRHHGRDGNLVITIITRPEYGPLIEAGIEAKRAELDRERDAAGGQGVPAETPEPTLGSTDDPGASTARGQGVPAGTPEAGELPARASEGEALLALAQEALGAEQQAHPEVARRRRTQLSAQVDPLSGWARLHDGEVLPPTSPALATETLPGRIGPGRLRPLRRSDLRRHDLGRSQRQVSIRLREQLGVLDGERCRFPGCTRRKRLHAHHVVYWSDGGGTDLSNLVLVCSRHHTLVHQVGFQLVLQADRRLSVSTADGVPLLHHPALPWGDPADLDPGGRVAASTSALENADARMDLGYVVSVLLAQAS